MCSSLFQQSQMPPNGTSKSKHEMCTDLWSQLFCTKNWLSKDVIITTHTIPQYLEQVESEEAFMLHLLQAHWFYQVLTYILACCV